MQQLVAILPVRALHVDSADRARAAGVAPVRAELFGGEPAIANYLFIHSRRRWSPRVHRGMIDAEIADGSATAARAGRGGSRGRLKADRRARRELGRAARAPAPTLALGGGEYLRVDFSARHNREANVEAVWIARCASCAIRLALEVAAAARGHRPPSAQPSQAGSPSASSPLGVAGDRRAPTFVPAAPI
jgi:hypothetical protein